MRQLLQDTTLTFIMSKHFCDTSSAIKRPRDMITSYTPQGSMSNQTEKLIEYLQNVLVGVDWSKLAFSARPMAIPGNILNLILHWTPLSYTKSVLETIMIQVITLLTSFLNQNQCIKILKTIKIVEIIIVVRSDPNKKFHVVTAMNLEISVWTVLNNGTWSGTKITSWTTILSV